MNFNELICKEKKYVIYGSNRVARDFAYIFSDYINIASFIADEDSLKDKSEYPIIVCDFDKEEKIARLESLGYVKGEDYYIEEDLFESLDSFHIPEDRELFIWGTGRNADLLGKKEQDLDITCYVDSYKDIDSFKGKPVIKPGQLTKNDACFVIISASECADIVKTLEEKGFVQYKDFIRINEYLSRPSSLLRQTIFDKAYYPLDCRTPLNHMEILRDGETSCCCTTFMDERLGNVYEHDVSEIWGSIRHKIISLSIQNRTYTFCKKNMCPLFVGIKKEEKVDATRDYCNVEDRPRNLVLAFDQICNLYCDTCREKMFIPDEDYKNNMQEMVKKVKAEYLPRADFLVLAGDGEVFGSPYYRDIFTSSESNHVKYIRLLSNGMLFNEKNWKALVKDKDVKVMLTVSVDAATKETYESIRRGGNFDILKKNMEFAAQLRKSGELRYFRMNFVVQNRNYLEMPLFVEWGEELGVDEVFFTKVLNWGTWSSEEFKNISMMEEDGNTPKEGLRKILDDPRMKSPIVDLGTIRYSHKADDVGIVDNYYKWELEKRGGIIFD